MTVRAGTAATRRRDPEREVLGERALWVFVLGDMTVFALFFVVLLVEYRLDRPGFSAAARELALPIGLVNTVVLLTGSYLVVLATRAHRDALTGRAASLLLGAVVSAVVFAGLKSVEYAVELRPGRLLPAGRFAVLYLVITGLHLLHVIIGSVLLLRWRRLAGTGEPWVQVARFTGGAAVYWHMVDLLWVVILTLVYLAVRVG